MILLINQSKLVSAADAQAMALLCDKQLRRDVAPAWGKVPWGVALFAGDLSHLPAGSLPIVLLDDSDQAGALGWHTEERGKLFGRVFARPTLEDGGSVLGTADNANAVIVTLSHEVAEAFVDPYCNAWWDGPTIREGNQYAAEIADPVEADAYSIELSTRSGSTKGYVSNFIWPSWGDHQALPAARFDQMRRLRQPFSMTRGGYMVVRSVVGAERQVFAETSEMDVEGVTRQLSKKSPLSRTYKRGIRV